MAGFARWRQFHRREIRQNIYVPEVSPCTTPKAVPDVGEVSLIMFRLTKVMGHLHSPLS